MAARFADAGRSDRMRFRQSRGIVPGTTLASSALVMEQNFHREQPAVTYPNDPRRPDILRKRDDSMSGALIGGIVIVLVLFLGLAIYMLNSGNRDVAATDPPKVERTTPAPSTTGQGGTRTMPGRDQNIPNPTPPVQPPTKPQQ
jgi:hypothetical protein